MDAVKAEYVRSGRPVLTPGFSSIFMGGDYTDRQLQFLTAMDRYKRSRHRPFPTWGEVLAVIDSLGYRQVEPAGMLPDVPANPNRERPLQER